MAKKDDNTTDLEQQLKRKGLCLKDIKGDGNCLFRALSDQLTGTQNSHKEIRTKICQHIIENQEEYQNYIEEKIKVYINRMNKLGVYGGNMELVAASRVYRVGIAIYQEGQEVWYIGFENSKEIVHIGYHSWEHYSSIRNINGPFTGLPNIVLKSNQDIVETKVKPTWVRSEDDDVSSSEMMIIKATNLDLKDIPKIRKLMIKFRGNPSNVIDFIYEEIEIKNNVLAVESDASVNQISKYTTDIFDETSVDIPEESKAGEPIEDVFIRVERKKKLTSRQKKDLARKKKLAKKTKTKVKDSDTDELVESVINVTSMLSI